MESTSNENHEPPFRIRMANAVGRVLVGRRWLDARLEMERDRAAHPKIVGECCSSSRLSDHREPGCSRRRDT